MAKTSVIITDHYVAKKITTSPNNADAYSISIIDQLPIIGIIEPTCFTVLTSKVEYGGELIGLIINCQNQLNNGNS